jgi:hypothetical protein
MPCFHTLGLHTQLFHPLFTGRPAAIFPPQYPEPPIVPSPVSVLDGLKRTKSHAVWVVPSLLEVCSILCPFLNASNAYILVLVFRPRGSPTIENSQHDCEL